MKKYLKIIFIVFICVTLIGCSSNESNNIEQITVQSSGNVLMSDASGFDAYTSFSSEWNNHVKYSCTVFGSEYLRSSIKNVLFLDSLDDAPTDAWDISDDEDQSVMAWVDDSGDSSVPYDLYIAGDGGVDANIDTRYLFAGYYNLESIDFNDCFYTGDAIDMSFMFYYCATLKDLDTSSLSTSSAYVMADMFRECISLTSLTLTSFDTSHVLDMKRMFYGCVSLKSLDLGSFDTTNVQDMSYMFYMCSSLTILYKTSSFTTSNAQTTDMYKGTYMNY
ncbi:MAG: DUF285 domain-containing protein [Erysipelotrichaceae bacterium]|nr:DUF285 domain-containing protein [Erysipelotrichaceae bacterium]